VSFLSFWGSFPAYPDLSHGGVVPYRDSGHQDTYPSPCASVNSVNKFISLWYPSCLSLYLSCSSLVRYLLCSSYLA
jgi:hypothetical protein